MWHNPPAVGLAATHRRVPTVALAFAVVTSLAALDAISGRELIIVGTLTTGPGIAAGAGRPRAVVAVGAYALVAINLLCWWPDQIWGSERHLVFSAVAVAMTGLGAGLAVQIRAGQRAEVLAENHWRALAAVVAHSDDAIIASDLQGRLTSYNAGAERLYGYPAGEIVGSSVPSFSALVTPPGAPGPADDEIAARIVGGEQGISFDTVRRHRDGTVKEVAMVVSPVRDQQDVVVGMSWVSRDIGARKRAEENSHQSERMASLGQLAGGVAHDFNNLLGIMLTFIAFAEESVSDPEVRTDLAKARLAGERAVILTSQLLTFTRQDPIQPETLEVNACIDEVRSMLARTIGADIDLIVHPAPRPLTIHADPGQIQQVLLSLAANARDAMPGGGTLIIEASETGPDQSDTDPEPDGGRFVRLQVSDTGTGMSADVAARVFEPFFTTKPMGSGTGLGLAAVYGIVTEAGGSINVYSEPGIGTTFRVYFPVVAGAPAALPVQPTTAPPHGHGRTVLIVDDEPALGEAVARILTGGGYRTLSADGAAQALVLDDEHGCDLLLTDVIMPETSGRQLAEAMLHRHPGLPVLFMSGYSDGLLGSDHVLNDGIDLIEKPFTPVDLLHQIGGMLPAIAGPAVAGRAAGSA